MSQMTMMETARFHECMTGQGALLVVCWANTCQGKFSTAVPGSKAFSVIPNECDCYRKVWEAMG